MANTGARSCEVIIQNMTTANFTIQGSNTSGSNAQWIQGEVPTTGDQLVEFTTVTFGVMNTDYNSGAGGMVVLGGYGDEFQINWNNDASGITTCTCPGNSMVKASVAQISTHENNHTQWSVRLDAS